MVSKGSFKAETHLGLSSGQDVIVNDCHNEIRVLISELFA